MTDGLQRERPWAIILAAGSGTRLAQAVNGVAKQFLVWRDAPLYWHCVLAMHRSGRVGGMVVVLPEAQREAESAAIARLARRDAITLPLRVTAGGALRQDSVRMGLARIPPHVEHVLVHDAARPFLSPALIHRVCDALREGASAVIPGLPVTDTIKLAEDGLVRATLPRHQLSAVQTPQGFACSALREAHVHASNTGLTVTDDAALMEAQGHVVHIVPGDAANRKITAPEDLAALTPRQDSAPCMGMGYDVHRYGGKRPMKLGGISIPSGPGIVAHSDGDVLLHALMDALLGCAALGDIGRHFPDVDSRLDNVSSAVLLDAVLDMLHERGVTPCHVDLTIVAQKPRISPHVEDIRQNVARLMGLDRHSVNVKATTEEGLGFTGSGEGIKAYAVVSARRDMTRAWCGA